MNSISNSKVLEGFDPSLILSQMGMTAGVAKGDSAELAGQVAEIVMNSVGLSVTESAPALKRFEPKGGALKPIMPSPKAIALLAAADLAAIVAKLTLICDELQAKLAKDRIEDQKGPIAKRNQDRQAKIKDSLKQMDKAARLSVFGKIFGWLGVVIAAAVAIAMSVVSGGVALGPMLGAAAALTFQILDATGTMKKMTEALADHLQDKYGYPRAKAMFFASLTTMAIQVGASLLSFGGGELVSAFSKSARFVTSAAAVAAMIEKAARLNTVVLGVTTGMLIGSLVAQGVSAKANQDSAEVNADLAELKKTLKMYMQALEIAQDMLHDIMQLIAGDSQAIERILEGAAECSKRVSMNIGRAALA